jgi:phosphoserine aminotransferase
MRAINFNAGPAGLPLEALEKAQAEFLDFRGTGMSIMEHSHRGKTYDAVHQETLAHLTRLLQIPKTHAVFFASGGASTQFALIPMNFLHMGQSADYVMTGVWTEKAFEEANIVGRVRSICSTRNVDGRYTRVPTQTAVDAEIDPLAAYVHSTSNNTVYGTQFLAPLRTKGRPHICDMSSDFLSRPLEISDYDLIYAGAQKNLGPSGVVVVVARKAFLESARSDIPKVLRYATHAENDSLYNTPNTLGIYLCGNVLEWIEGQGGLAGMQARNQRKATALYRCVDESQGFYTCPVELASRSVMNMVFHCPSEALNELFVTQAAKEHMVGLKGYRTTGGIRVSAYNAVSLNDIETLTSFMKLFAAQH